MFAEHPEDERESKPTESGDGKDEPTGVRRERTPNDNGKGDEADGTDGSSRRVDGSGFAAPMSTVEANLLFLLDFMFFNERGAGRKDGRESEEESADAGAIVFCDDTGKSCHQTAKEETDGIFVRLDGFERGEVSFDFH